MNSRQFFTGLFVILVCVILAIPQNRQTLTVIPETSTNSSAAAIAIQLPDGSIINKIRVNSETSDFSVVKDITGSRSLFFAVNLVEGHNHFNIIGYADNRIVYISETPIVIERNRKAPASISLPDNSSSGSRPDPKADQKKETKLSVIPQQDRRSLTDNKLTLQITSAPDWPTEARYFIARASVDGGEIYETRYALVPEAGSDKPTKQQTIVVGLHHGKNVIDLALVKDDKKTPIDGYTAKTEIECLLACGDSAPTARAVIGFEQIGASSTNSQGSPFLDIFVNAPLWKGRKKGFSIWSNIRLSSIPVQTLVDFGTVGGVNTFLNASAKPNELAQSFDFLVGIEKSTGIKGPFGNGFMPGRTSLSLIAAAGAVNPLSVERTAQIYKVPTGNAAFNQAFPGLDGSSFTHIAFVSPDRGRFYRQYYGGIRLRTIFYDQEKHVRNDVFPALVDIMAGQNESITGKLLGVIIRANGSTPLPIKDGMLSIFGSAQVRLGKGRNENQRTPLFLPAADPNATLSQSTTFIVPFEKNPGVISNRDTFRLGLGVDIFRLFKESGKK